MDTPPPQGARPVNMPKRGMNGRVQHLARATESSTASQDSQVGQVVRVELFSGVVTAEPLFGPQAAAKTTFAATLDARRFSRDASTIIADAEGFFKTVGHRRQDESESLRQTDCLITDRVPSKRWEIVEADRALVAMVDATDTAFDTGTNDLTMSSACSASCGPEPVTKRGMKGRVQHLAMATESSAASQDSQVCQVVLVELFGGVVTAEPLFGPQAAAKTPLAARLDARQSSSVAATMIADAEGFFKTMDLRLRDEPESHRQTDCLITEGVPSKSRKIVEADRALAAMLDAIDTTFDSGTTDSTVLAGPSQPRRSWRDLRAFGCCARD